MAESARAGTHLDSGRERIPHCRTAALKLRASNEIHTNGMMKSRLVFDNVRE